MCVLQSARGWCVHFCKGGNTEESITLHIREMKTLYELMRLSRKYPELGELSGAVWCPDS